MNNSSQTVPLALNIFRKVLRKFHSVVQKKLVKRKQVRMEEHANGYMDRHNDY